MVCGSCNRELDKRDLQDVPGLIPCCLKCWKQIPVAERLRLHAVFRDRQPGGALAELADLLMRTIDLYQKEDK